MSNIGNQLKNIRENLGLTRKELGNLLVFIYQGYRPEEPKFFHALNTYGAAIGQYEKNKIKPSLVSLFPYLVISAAYDLPLKVDIDFLGKLDQTRAFEWGLVGEDGYLNASHYLPVQFAYPTIEDLNRLNLRALKKLAKSYGLPFNKKNMLLQVIGSPEEFGGSIL